MSTPAFISFVPVERIETPCINICSIDPVDGLCEGCRRSVDEIARWTAMSAGERARIMAELKRR